MLAKVKDFFSCSNGSICRKKEIIVSEITNLSNEGIFLSPIITDNNNPDAKNKQIDSSFTASHIDLNTTTEISNSKSLSSIYQKITGKHNQILNQIKEEHEDEIGDHANLAKFSNIKVEEEDTFRNNKRTDKTMEKNNTQEIEYEKLKPYWVDKILILDKEIFNNNSFELTDEEGTLLFNQRLILNAGGLVNSLRHLRDGHAFFGTVENYKNFIINDFILNKEKTEHSKRVFMIYFDRTEARFFIKNLEEKKASVYLKLTKSICIESKCYAQIGDELLKFDLTSDKTLQITDINNKTSMRYLFPQSIKSLTIGRSDKCNIVINSNLLSQIHCTIRFKEELNKWEIIDGSGKKPSTNGTWFLAQNAIPLCNNDPSKEEMYIKIGQDVIKMTKL